jgi:hypothetical protein
MKKQYLIAAFMVAVLIAGCMPDASRGLDGTPLPQPSETQPSTSIPLTPEEIDGSTATPVPTETSPSPTLAGTDGPGGDVMKQPAPYDKALEPYVEQAKDDLLQRLPSLSVDQIEVVEAKAVVWPDAAMGCPQPGMVYIQVPVDGLLVRLRVKGQLFNYHGGGPRGLFLCEGKLSGSKPTVPPLDPFATPSKSADS